ncbi:hypothetical protein P8452_03237 [Trifolium repens]|nr:hypothetical protein P8452_03237 [Trifolium repens]
MLLQWLELLHQPICFLSFSISRANVDSSTLKVFGLAIHLFLQCCETECEQFLRLYCFVSLFRAGLVSPGFPATVFSLHFTIPLEPVSEAILFFVEFPVGVGFPYNNIAFDLTILEDHFVAEDAYKLWMNWLQSYVSKGNECLPLISGGEIASTFDNPESVKLG